MFILWKNVEILNLHRMLWKNVELQTNNPSAFVPWKRENRGVYIERDVFHAEMPVEALQSHFRRIVVLAEMTQHNVLNARMIDFGDESCRLCITEMPKRS